MQLPNSTQKEIGHPKDMLEFYFEATTISEAEKTGGVFTIVGSEIYKPIRGLIAHRKPKELVYDTLMKELDTHYGES